MGKIVENQKEVKKLLKEDAKIEKDKLMRWKQEQVYKMKVRGQVRKNIADKREPTIYEVKKLTDFYQATAEFWQAPPSNTLWEYLGNNIFGAVFREVDKVSLGIKIDIEVRNRQEQV